MMFVVMVFDPPSIGFSFLSGHSTIFDYRCRGYAIVVVRLPNIALLEDHHLLVFIL